jgi:hypothetical protein
MQPKPDRLSGLEVFAPLDALHVMGRVGRPAGTAAARLAPAGSYVSELAISAHKGGLDCTKTPVYRGDGTKVARPNVDVKVDKKSGLLIPEKSGLSVHVDQQKLLGRFNLGPRVKSIPDELQGIQQGKDPGHYGITANQPMTSKRFQELSAGA